MGLFDTVCCKVKTPGAELLGDREFQTKDLGQLMERFTICENGWLIHHRTRRKACEPWRCEADRDVVVPLHRDLVLFGDDSVGKASNFVVRFTHGRLEQVMAWDDVPPEYRDYLLAGD